MAAGSWCQLSICRSKRIAAGWYDEEMRCKNEISEERKSDSTATKLAQCTDVLSGNGLDVHQKPYFPWFTLSPFHLKTWDEKKAITWAVLSALDMIYTYYLGFAVLGFTGRGLIVREYPRTLSRCATKTLQREVYPRKRRWISFSFYPMILIWHKCTREFW
jgi:hypothetical protein